MPIGREIYAADEPFELLGGGNAAISADFPDVHAHAHIDAFLAGQIVSCCLCGDHSATLKRLQDVDEVWVFCFRKVMKSEWRMMGRFSKPNVFIALRMYERRDLSPRRKYTEAANDFIDLWDKTFYGSPPRRGNRSSDYLTGPVNDLDNQIA
jgi:hypothetical protein